MKKQGNNNVRNISFAIVAVALIIAIAGGGTYAWWRWRSADTQKTNVTVTIQKPGFTIVGETASSNTLTPTSACYNTPATNHVQHTLAGKATVTATNNTSTKMRAKINLKAMLANAVTGNITDEQNNTTSRKSHIHWAIKKVTNGTTAFSTDNCTGTAGGTEYDTGNFDAVGTSFTDIATTITFDVNAGATVTNYYHVYVWIDSDYKHENVGNTQNDPLQNNTITITFSETSEFTQDLS